MRCATWRPVAIGMGLQPQCIHTNRGYTYTQPSSEAWGGYRTASINRHRDRGRLQIPCERGLAWKFVANDQSSYHSFPRGSSGAAGHMRSLPPMFMHRLLSWIRTTGNVSPEPQDEPGIIISRRLKELVPVERPKPVETVLTESPSEEEENRTNREKFGT